MNIIQFMNINQIRKSKKECLIPENNHTKIGEK